MTACSRGCIRVRWQEGQCIRTSRQAHADMLLCSACYDRLTDMLTDIGAYIGMLDDVRERGVADVHQPGVKLRSVASEQAPMNLAVTALEDRRTRPRYVERDDGRVDIVGPVSIPGILSGWCDLVIEGRRLSEEPHVVADCLKILWTHVAWCASQPWIADMWAEIDVLHRQLGDVVGEPRPQPVGRCPVDDCGAALFMPKGDREPLRCRSCGAIWEREQWGILAAALTQGGAS